MVRQKQVEPAVAPLDVTNVLGLNAQMERELERLVYTYDMETLNRTDATHHSLLAMAHRETQVIRDCLDMYRRFTHS